MLRNSTQHVCPDALKKLAAGFLFCLAPVTMQALAQTGVTQQAVLVYNWAQVPAKVLAQAEERAARIFRKAGVQVLFVECPLTGEKCSDHLSGRAIALNVVRDNGNYPNGHAMGFSAPAEEGGSHAVVLHDRVERFAALPNAGVSLPQILGHVIAHELGHLMLSLVGHTPSGLMHAPWNRDDISLMSKGSLIFTDAQAAEMQEQAKRRAAASMIALAQ